VLAPSLPIVSDAAEAAFAAADGVVVFGPRSGSKTRQFSIPDGLPPGPLRSLIPMRVIEVASMRPGVRKPLSGEIDGAAERWLEHIETDARVLARFADGWPALAAEGRYHYLGLWPDAAALSSLMSCVARKAGLAIVALPEGVRLRRRGDLIFAFNYGVEPWPVPFVAGPILGDAVVAPRSYAVWMT
jgi:beta-galactosidase